MADPTSFVTCGLRARCAAWRAASAACGAPGKSGAPHTTAARRSKPAAADIRLFAANEPVFLEGANAAAILFRRMKQGIAEWFRIQIGPRSKSGNAGPARRLTIEASIQF
jgi:hypothetical protein